MVPAGRQGHRGHPDPADRRDQAGRPGHPVRQAPVARPAPRDRAVPQDHLVLPAQAARLGRWVLRGRVVPAGRRGHRGHPDPAGHRGHPDPADHRDQAGRAGHRDLPDPLVPQAQRPAPPTPARRPRSMSIKPLAAIATLASRAGRVRARRSRGHGTKSRSRSVTPIRSTWPPGTTVVGRTWWGTASEWEPMLRQPPMGRGLTSPALRLRSRQPRARQLARLHR